MNDGDQIVIDGVLASERMGEEGAYYYLVSIPGNPEPIPVIEECIRAVNPKSGVSDGLSFKINLRRYRYLRNFSQKELGDAIGVRQGAVWQWEHGRTTPSHENLIALTEALGVSVNDLMERVH